MAEGGIGLSKQLLLVLYVLAASAAGRFAGAHEMPADARLNAFVVPAGRTLSLLVRVPLASLGDIDYPAGERNTVVVSQADASLRNAATVWILPAIEVLENGRPLPPARIAATRMSLPSDRSFESWPEARAGMDRPRIADGPDIYWSQQMLDVLLEYPIESDRSRFAIEMRVDRFGQSVSTALRLLAPAGATRAFAVHGNAGRIELDPSWVQSALRFTVEGIRHILTGTDHLLFLGCLVIPFRRFRPLVAIVTAFTIAHSITLVAAALGFGPDMLWFPPLVETLIAVSILYMALDNILGTTLPRRWMLTFAFGLVHGFGFSFGLRETMQFAGDHLITSLIAFNVGVEIGQLGVLVMLVPILQFFLSHLPSERMGVIVLSALVGHVAWHWLADRWGDLAKFPLPAFDLLFLAGLMRGTMAVLLVGGLVWAVHGPVDRWLGQASGLGPLPRWRRRKGS